MFENIIVRSLTDERLMSREKALGIALGNINPITGEVIANFSPCKTKVSNSLLDNEHIALVVVKKILILSWARA